MSELKFNVDTEFKTADGTDIGKISMYYSNTLSKLNDAKTYEIYYTRYKNETFKITTDQYGRITNIY